MPAPASCLAPIARCLDGATEAWTGRRVTVREFGVMTLSLPALPSHIGRFASIRLLPPAPISAPPRTRPRWTAVIIIKVAGAGLGRSPSLAAAASTPRRHPPAALLASDVSRGLCCCTSPPRRGEITRASPSVGAVLARRVFATRTAKRSAPGPVVGLVEPLVTSVDGLGADSFSNETGGHLGGEALLIARMGSSAAPPLFRRKLLLVEGVKDTVADACEVDAPPRG